MITATYHNMLNFVNKFFGGFGSSSLKSYENIVNKINEFETEISKLTDDELKNKTNYFKDKVHVENEITPWDTFRLKFTNPDEVEHRRRWAAFHAADTERNNHLNLHEFISAMQSLGFSGGGNDALREYFHSADENEDGILEIDEFLRGVEELDFD